MSRAACTHDGCERQSKRNGLCVAHYDRWRRQVDPECRQRHNERNAARMRARRDAGKGETQEAHRLRMAGYRAAVRSGVRPACLSCGSTFDRIKLERHCQACTPAVVQSRPQTHNICACGSAARTPRAKRCSGCEAALRREDMRARYHADKAAQGDGRTPAKWRAAVDRRSARLAHAYIEDIDVRVLADRDQWRCHICGYKVPRKATHPNPKSASIDHLVPVSEGGEHSYRNTALAHLRCNLAKNVKAIGEQLRLIG